MNQKYNGVIIVMMKSADLRYKAACYNYYIIIFFFHTWRIIFIIFWCLQIHWILMYFGKLNKKTLKIILFFKLYTCHKKGNDRT